MEQDGKNIQYEACDVTENGHFNNNNRSLFLAKCADLKHDSFSNFDTIRILCLGLRFDLGTMLHTTKTGVSSQQL